MEKGNMKTRLPRKLKKRMKHSIVMLDMSSIPAGCSLQQWMYMYKTFGVIVYTNNKPEVISASRIDLKNKKHFDS